MTSYSPSHVSTTIIHHATCVCSNSMNISGQPNAVLSPMDGQLVVINNSVAMLTCSDSVGIPTPLFNWTYGGNPRNRVIAGTACYNIIIQLYMHNKQ